MQQGYSREHNRKLPLPSWDCLGNGTYLVRLLGELNKILIKYQPEQSWYVTDIPPMLDIITM